MLVKRSFVFQVYSDVFNTLTLFLVPQQGDMFHAAPDRGAVFTGGPRWSHSTALLDHQSQETTGVHA